MDKNDKTLLDLEKKIDNYNQKEHTLKNLRINKPNMNMNNINNKFNKDNLLSFLNNFKKENEKIINSIDKDKYNIEYEQEDNEDDDDDEEEEEDVEIKNESINLDENEEDINGKKHNEKRKSKKNKKEKIEIDLLMGILEQQKKKEININNIKDIKKKEKDEKDDVAHQEDDIQKGEKEIIDFLLEKK